MEFDEIEYLEKTVEEAEDRGNLRRKKEENDRNDNNYRKREIDEGIGREDAREKRQRSEDRHRRDGYRDSELERGERHGERDRGKERERDGRERDREHSRDRERERSHRDRERDRDRDREKYRDRRDKERDDKERREKRDREKDDERDRRERSISRSRRHESDRERERELREREIELRERESRRFKEKKEVPEPEADPERDQRTVFAYQMPLKATERDVYEFFSKVGKVRDVRLIMDRNSRRSKGVGYIEFYDVMSVPMAIALSGQLLLGQPVMVKPSEAEKNLVQSASSVGAGPYGPVERKLYVGNLHFNMTEIQLRQIFEPFGTVELVQMPLEIETGHCKGFGFVQFAQVESAKAAQSALNGKLEIAGRTIKVSSVTEHGGQQDPSTKTADFDDDEGGGLALNAQSRALLMQKLDRTGTASSITGSLGVPMLNGTIANQQPMSMPVAGQPAIALPVQNPVMATAASEPIGQASECLLLKNMFDPSTESEPDFDLDIKEDVEEECSKYGLVKHIYVDKNSAGRVYLRFESIDAAVKAQRAMHMRWFAQRLISAIFMQPHEYEARFQM